MDGPCLNKGITVPTVLWPQNNTLMHQDPNQSWYTSLYRIFYYSHETMPINFDDLWSSGTWDTKKMSTATAPSLPPLGLILEHALTREPTSKCWSVIRFFAYEVRDLSWMVMFYVIHQQQFLMSIHFVIGSTDHFWMIGLQIALMSIQISLMK